MSPYNNMVSSDILLFPFIIVSFITSAFKKEKLKTNIKIIVSNLFINYLILLKVVFLAQLLIVNI